MVGRALVVLIAVFLGVASAQTCEDGFTNVQQVTIGDASFQNFQFRSNGKKVGEVDIQPNLNTMNFIFKASNGYELVGAKGGMYEDCSIVPAGSARWQFQETTSPRGQISHSLSYSHVFAPPEGCCDRSWCFVFQAKIQKKPFIPGTPSFPNLYRTSSTDPRCTTASDGFPVCAGALSCECPNPCSSFMQVGQDLDGSAIGDSYGNAVEISADGSRMIIGAYRADSNDRGQARLYELQRGTWVQRGGTIEGDSSYDRMGWSADISADGTRIAVGATQNDNAVRDGGLVRVYDLDDANDTLVQVGGDIQGVVRDELSGYSLALSDDGTHVAIGATKNGSNGYWAGQVRVFTYDSINDVWTQVGSSINGNGASRMGNSVALSEDGSRLLVGTPKGSNTNGEETGLIKVFELVNDEWVQLGSTIYGEGTQAGFGTNSALSADGTILASGSDSWGIGGIMQVYQFSTTDDDWVQLGEDILAEAANDAFGIDVDMTPDGHTLAIGGNRNDGNGFNSGYVQIYKLVNDAWVQVDSDIDGEASNDLSGGQVAISADGSRVAIGAQAATLGDTGNRGGHVRVFNESLRCCSA